MSPAQSQAGTVLHLASGLLPNRYMTCVSRHSRCHIFVLVVINKRRNVFTGVNTGAHVAYTIDSIRSNQLVYVKKVLCELNFARIEFLALN